jgi:uncharacterized protein
MIEQLYLPAGEFASWLSQTRHSLADECGVDLPCGECTACCTSSYFINIRPDDVLTICSIPKELMFSAPGLPKGNLLLGYDEHGHCPMFIDGKCSIYEFRPLTCRSYDCRLFAAAGIDAGDEDKALINSHVKRWMFSYPTKLDRDLHSAVQTAAQFLRNRAECFPPGTIPKNQTRLALLALKVHEVFLAFAVEKENTGREMSEKEIVEAIMTSIGGNTKKDL